MYFSHRGVLKVIVSFSRVQNNRIDVSIFAEKKRKFSIIKTQRVLFCDTCKLLVEHPMLVSCIAYYKAGAECYCMVYVYCKLIPLL